MTERTFTYRDTETLVSRLCEELAISLEMFEEHPAAWSIETLEALEAGVFYLRNCNRDVPEPVRWVLFRAESPLNDGCPLGPYWANKPSNDS